MDNHKPNNRLLLLSTMLTITFLATHAEPSFGQYQIICFACTSRYKAAEQPEVSPETFLAMLKTEKMAMIF